MTTLAKDLLKRIASWPAEDTAELDEIARDIEARRTGIYKLSEDEKKAVHKGMAEIRAGKIVSAATVRKADKRRGL